MLLLSAKALRQEALNNGSGAYHIPCTASREYFDHNGCRRIAVFGLHGQYTISTAQESYTIGASEVYAVSPFTLYRAVSGEDAGVLQITLSPEILQKADWPQRQMIDCYLSRSTLTDSVAQDIRRRCATLFRLYFSAD